MRCVGGLEMVWLFVGWLMCRMIAEWLICQVFIRLVCHVFIGCLF